jgi:hypothetical protein
VEGFIYPLVVGLTRDVRQSGMKGSRRDQMGAESLTSQILEEGAGRAGFGLRRVIKCFEFPARNNSTPPSGNMLRGQGCVLNQS